MSRMRYQAEQEQEQVEVCHDWDNTLWTMGSLAFISLALFLSTLPWILIAAILSGVVAYFQLIQNPWKNLLNFYFQFKEIDDYAKSFRDRLIYEEIIYRFVNVEVGRWGWELYRLLPTWKTTRSELSPAETTFRYTPIVETRSIRLLKILEWSPIRGLHAEIEEASLDDICAYETISYRWGDPLERLKTRIITLNGQAFAVSQNVYDILEHFSSIRHPVYIWIDFICINQDNILERNHQVTLMREIYQRARSVVVWLGSAPHGHLANFLLYKIYNVKYNLKLTNEAIHDMYSKHGARHTRPWLELGKLFRNPYFDRLWVVQEIASASSIKVLYDGKEIDWVVLQLVMNLFTDTHLLLLFLGMHEGNFLIRKKPPNKEIVHCLSMARFQGMIRRGEGVTLKDVVTWTRGFEAREPKDQVFALVGITDDPTHRLLLPDYRKTTRDTFRDMSLYLLNNSDPFILYYAGCGHPRSILDLPSWVPDLTSQTQILTHGTAFMPYAASGDTKANIITYPENPDVIKVSCSIIDTIAFLGSPSDPYSAYQDPDFTSNLSSWVSGFHSTREANILAVKHAHDPYHTGQSLAEALWRAAIGDKTLTERPAPNEYGTYYSCFVSLFSDPAKIEKQLRVLEQGLQRRGKNIDPENLFDHDYREKSRMATKYTAMASLVSVDKRFCVTEKGYIGWVPNGSMVGDKVTLILGGQTPFLMRRCEGAFGEVGDDGLDFALVGACYLHGMMDGEGLNGNEEVKHVILH